MDDNGAIPPEQPTSSGGSGEVQDAHPYGDGLKTQRLERRAMRGRWPVREDAKEVMVNRQISISIDPATPPRNATQAFLAVLRADSLNMEEERAIADAGKPPAGVTIVTDNVNILSDAERVERLAALYERVRARRGEHADGCNGHASSGGNGALPH